MPLSAIHVNQFFNFYYNSGDTFRGTETVLFVDYEDMIIEVADELFEQLGYKVLIARSGKEAIETYEKTRNGLTSCFWT